MGEKQSGSERFREVVEFDGRKYYRYPFARYRWQREYFICSSNGKPLHEAVWEKANGPKPAGCEIHHKDGNSFNNALENLECLTKEEHLQRHVELGTRKNNRKGNNPVICDICGKTFEGHNGTTPYRVCSEQCLARARLAAMRFIKFVGSDSLDREFNGDGSHVCENCGQPFIPGRTDSKFCCQKCRDAYAWKHGLTTVQRKKPYTVTCAVCGKTFETRNKGTRCCSQSCVNYYRWHKDSL
jgi:hypothetical protein